ncbi:response regulator [Pectobacterium parmentieri]|uniref:Capsular synthesis regulator component B n=1 Tax=Pectobacterium parmentieri TaxID=1905730 RepID=A0A0H3I2M3_PECPM|nr:response regulator [Pectobacterium parmentieri]AFI89644.1 Capsular synthesis regulator component B [Pectobacterium parmentieri]MBI0472068.1 response regulator [Pectobacterium parmentieri]MBI0495177.1 response regulator [Pectobacterium parmentieri]MBI0556229.1 response regulator [Pectobacterium parmentieri]MBI0569313.1 response regulator [Pectobacterium parmentieri]
MHKSIVIADDHPVFLIGLRAVITSAFSDNYVINGEAHNVDQLLELLEKEQPDVLLTDFNMPGNKQSDGLRLIATLRRKYPNLSIVVVTMLANPGLVNSVLAAGVYAVINKQSLTTELTQCLKALQQGRYYATPMNTEDTVAMSPRELEVVRLLAQGKSVNDIAAMLNRTKQTISAQKKSAMNKIGVNSTSELLEYLHSVGL